MTCRVDTVNALEASLHQSANNTAEPPKSARARGGGADKEDGFVLAAPLARNMGFPSRIEVAGGVKAKGREFGKVST